MTENEKIERLMQPRYKVIADYPGRPSSMPIGHILILDKFGAGKWWHEYTDLEPIHIDEGSKRFPVVLKQLEWWEERTAEEMPEYVKLVKNAKGFGLPDNCIRSVIEWDMNLKPPRADCFPVTINAGNLIPATKEQYLSQVKTIQNK